MPLDKDRQTFAVHSSSVTLVGNSNTSPLGSAANKPNAGSSPDKNPDANTTAELPPKADQGATKSAIDAPPVGATPTT